MSIRKRASSEKELRPAQLFAMRFRMANEDRDVKLAMAQSRQERKDRMIERQLTTSQCKLRYYK